MGDPADQQRVASARAEVAALDVALMRVRSAPDAPEALGDLARLLEALAAGQGAALHPGLGVRTQEALRAVRGARCIDADLWHALELLRHQLEAALATARTEADRRAPPAATQRAQPSPIRQRLLIAVLGDGLDQRNSRDAAYRAGAALARAGTNLLCGGMGGVMEAAARGFREASGEGLVVGLLPGGERHEANRWVDLPLPTGVDQAQCALVAEAADAAVSVGGGGGTLGEVGLLLRHRKPVCVVSGTGGISDSIVGLRIGATAVLDAREPEDAVLLVLRALAGSPGEDSARTHLPRDA